MNIMDRLADLQSSTKGCVLVALADVSSGIILCNSSAMKQPQERLNALGANACKLLASEIPAPLLALSTDQKSSAFDEVVTLNGANTQVFLRSQKELNDALCCICSPQTDIPAFMTRARSVLDQIAEAP